MHRAPATAWTVAALARASGMSRSAFALRFRRSVGVAPLEYLTRWRMMRARHALRDASTSLADLAASLGYASESAFGNAFRRIHGCSPRRYWPSRPAAEAPAGATDGVSRPSARRS
nr:helix-turn-helix transcriptional regulator [Aurantimonas sp. CSK15Z-1]